MRGRDVPRTTPEYNEPLDASHGPGITGQRIQRGQTIALLRQLATVAKRSG